MNEYIIPILNKWKIDSGVAEPIHFKFNFTKHTLTIYSSKVGYLIGHKGYYVDKYRKIFAEELRIDNLIIEFDETDGIVL